MRFGLFKNSGLCGEGNSFENIHGAEKANRNVPSLDAAAFSLNQAQLERRQKHRNDALLRVPGRYFNESPRKLTFFNFHQFHQVTELSSGSGGLQRQLRPSPPTGQEQEESSVSPWLHRVQQITFPGAYIRKTWL